MPSSEKVDATHAPERGGELDKVFVQSTANLSAPGFLLGKVRTGHMRWMNVLVCVLFISQESIVAVGKSKVTSTKEQRTTQAWCKTTSIEGRVHRTAHFTAARKPAACIYFSAFRRMRLTHSTVVRKAYVKIILRT